VSWLLTHATGLNLGISIAQFFLGIAIGLWVRPELLTKGKSAEWAFGFWTSQWFIFSVTYLVIWRYPTHEALLLLLLDIQSLLILATASTLLLGEPLKLGRALIILGILSCAFGFYNFAFDPWDVFFRIFGLHQAQNVECKRAAFVLRPVSETAAYGSGNLLAGKPALVQRRAGLERLVTALVVATGASCREKFLA
jgi:hypothetical protein